MCVCVCVCVCVCILRLKNQANGGWEKKEMEKKISSQKKNCHLPDSELFY